MTRDHAPVEMDFESAAEHYSGRTTYLPDFFARAVELFGLSKSSTVLDLGCGTAELSLGFAPYCKSVLAVDRSARMMSHRRGTPDNVRFLVADLNAEIEPLPVRADLVVIGMAVHFFDSAKLIRLLDAVTAPHASVFVCGATISTKTPWYAEYVRLRDRYSTLRVPLDVRGRACFAATRWSLGRNLVVSASRQLRARDLLDHALSYPTALEGILRNKADFERSLETLLTPYCKGHNHVDVEIVSWGLEYRRT